MTDSTLRENAREDLEAHALREYKYDVNGADGVNESDADGHALNRELICDISGADGASAPDVEGQRLRPPTNTDDSSDDTSTEDAE